jgi:hypothetical protein
MRTSRDVIFDESRPFYPRPTTNASPASLVDPLSFLLFPDAPPASLHIPRSTLPSYVSSSESPPVVPDYTMKPPVTQFYSRRRARLSDAPASSDEFFLMCHDMFSNNSSSKIVLRASEIIYIMYKLLCHDMPYNNNYYYNKKLGFAKIKPLRPTAAGSRCGFASWVCACVQQCLPAVFSNGCA